MSDTANRETNALYCAKVGLQVTQYLKILLQVTQGDDTQECELLVPMGLMYCGFKIGFLAPLSFENLIGTIIRRRCTASLARNAESDSLEELLLSLPEERFEVCEGNYRLVVERVDDVANIRH